MSPLLPSTPEPSFLTHHDSPSSPQTREQKLRVRAHALARSKPTSPPARHLFRGHENPAREQPSASVSPPRNGFKGFCSFSASFPKPPPETISSASYPHPHPHTQQQRPGSLSSPQFMELSQVESKAKPSIQLLSSNEANHVCKIQPSLISSPNFVVYGLITAGFKPCSS